MIKETEIPRGRKGIESRHDKTNKMSMLPAKTQISLGIRPADQSLRCPHEESLGPWLLIERIAKTLIRLGACPGWSESSLGTHSFCWFCHVAAQIHNSVLYVSTAKFELWHGLKVQKHFSFRNKTFFFFIFVLHSHNYVFLVPTISYFSLPI